MVSAKLELMDSWGVSAADALLVMIGQVTP